MILTAVEVVGSEVKVETALADLAAAVDTVVMEVEDRLAAAAALEETAATVVVAAAAVVVFLLMVVQVKTEKI